MSGPTGPGIVPRLAPDLHQELLAGMAAVAPGRRPPMEARRSEPASRRGRPTTSTLSIDEALLLHSVGWEAVELAMGCSVWRLPYIGSTWGRTGGEIPGTWPGYQQALDAASQRLGAAARRARAAGVVGVQIDGTVGSSLVEVQLVGTAVRPVGGAGAGDGARAGDGAERGEGRGEPFVSDLSARDFALLLRAGWTPLGLAFGASFVYAPRRSAGDALRQTTQNVELANYTEAMYEARELAMERMQDRAMALGADGVVAVSVAEGPMRALSHTVRFTAVGTAVQLVAESHRAVRPTAVVPLDDRSLLFQARSLR